jgi:hypothetical protein
MEGDRRRESEKAHRLSHEPQSGVTAAWNDANGVQAVAP